MPDKPPLTPPPRTVPASLRFRVLLGGVLPIIAWPMLAIGGFLATVFTGNSELATGWRFAGELAEVDGAVLTSEETNMRSNNQDVLSVKFVYTVNGEEFEGRSFTKQQPPAKDAAVTVEHRVDKPEVARIKGMGSAPFGAIAGITMLFPTLGFIMLMIGYFSGKRRIQLMRDGTSAWGLLTDKQSTNTRINNQRVYKLTFAFVDDGGNQRKASDRTHKSQFFSDETARHVLWDGESGDSCIVELIPGKPKIRDGCWEPISTVRLILLFVPAVIVLGLVYAASFITV